MKLPITGIVLTSNSQSTIKKALTSLSFCREIILLDNHSIDQTLSLAASFHPQIYSHSLANDFALHRNFALKKSTSPWTLFLDSDEQISPLLQSELYSAFTHPPKTTGFYFPRLDFFLSKPLTHGETASLKFLRLAKTQAGSWQNPVHETWQIKGPTQTFTHPIWHTPHQDLSTFFAKIDFYTTLATPQKPTSRPRLVLEIFTFPLAKFLKNYLLYLGFLDGFPGLIMAYFMSLHSLILRIKRYEQTFI